MKRKRDSNEESNNNENPTTPDINENVNNTPRKKRGRKPIFKEPKIIDPSIYENTKIQDAKKTNKEERNRRRLEPDVQYDLQMDQNNLNKKKDTTLHDILRAIVMLKDNKEYNLFDALNNTNAGITFAQLFAVSPSLRKLCSKGLKLNNEDIRNIKMIRNFDINSNENSIVNDTIEEIKYVINNNFINLLESPNLS